MIGPRGLEHFGQSASIIKDFLRYNRMEITVPELSLVVLVGASGSGKSTFARKHFKPTEILASDECRALISDDENDQTITPEAFELLYYIASKRLALLAPAAPAEAQNTTPRVLVFLLLGLQSAHGVIFYTLREAQVFIES